MEIKSIIELIFCILGLLIFYKTERSLKKREKKLDEILSILTKK